MGNLRIIIAGGGTGGHLFPALAIGEEILNRNPKAKIHYIGSQFGLEAKVFPIKDVWHTLLPISGLQRGFMLNSISRNLILPFRIIRSIHKCKKIFNNFLPQLVIGTGGYASAIPLLLAINNRKKIPIILQEQNSFPGLTTKWFAKKAKSICIAFDDKNIRYNGKTIHTGNPIRKGITRGDKKSGYSSFKLKNNCKTIFLFGGSQGSSFLNKILKSIIKNIADAGLQILWQTGDKDYNNYAYLNSKNIHVTPFINNMADAYAISDLIICRSGALTLAEITVCGKPCILIPYHYAAGNHQEKNAKTLEKAKAATVLLEKNLNKKGLLYTIMNLIHNDQKLLKMQKASTLIGKPNATNKIVDNVFNILS